MGVTPSKSIVFTGNAVPFRIDFNPPLANNPFGVMVTLQSPNADLDVIHYVESYDRTGINLKINRVAGFETVGGAADTRSREWTIAAHYFAIAKPTIS
ncbi:MAG: hypothetical protein ACO3UU_09520 [Minisyncoccia bacterium]